MVADIEELEEMDASELLTPQRSENFIFPVAGWKQSKSLGENSV